MKTEVQNMPIVVVFSEYGFTAKIFDKQLTIGKKADISLPVPGIHEQLCVFEKGNGQDYFLPSSSFVRCQIDQKPAVQGSKYPLKHGDTIHVFLPDDQVITLVYLQSYQKDNQLQKIELNPSLQEIQITRPGLDTVQNSLTIHKTPSGWVLQNHESEQSVLLNNVPAAGLTVLHKGDCIRIKDSLLFLLNNDFYHFGPSVQQEVQPEEAEPDFEEDLTYEEWLQSELNEEGAESKAVLDSFSPVMSAPEFSAAASVHSVESGYMAETSGSSLKGTLSPARALESGSSPYSYSGTMSGLEDGPAPASSLGPARVLTPETGGVSTRPPVTSIHPGFVPGTPPKTDPVRPIPARRPRRTYSGPSLSIHIQERSVRSKMKKLVLLQDINMTVYPGEMVLILGGSGAGKTTFMNAVMGYEKAVGQIRHGERDIYKDFDEMKYEIGFVPQQDLLRGSDSVYKTLMNAADMKLDSRMPKERKEQRVKEVLHKLGLEREIHSLVSKLSGGQRKRLSIAVEYIADPSLFFLDEPDSGLDGIMAKSLMANLRSIADEGKIVMVISHGPDRASELFDKVIVLAKSARDNCGHLAFYGSVPEAYTFFDTDTLEGVVKRINRSDEGGDEQSDYYISKYYASTRGMRY